LLQLPQQGVDLLRRRRDGVLQAADLVCRLLLPQL